MSIPGHGNVDLRFKIFFFHLVMVFLLMVVMTLVELRRLQEGEEAQRELKSQTIAKSLESVLLRMIVERDTASLGSIAKTITSSEIPGNDILSVVINDASMEEIVKSRQAFRRSGAGSGGGNDSGNGGSRADESEETLDSDPISTPPREIRPPGGTEPVGYLQFGFSQEAFSRKKSDLLTSNLLWALAFGVLAFFWSWLLANVLNRPLKALAAAVNRVSQGDMQPETGINSEDEIGTLVSAFNRMTQTISLHLEDLRGKNQVLDRRVFELSTLHQAGRAINSVLNLDQLYECIVDTTISVLGGVKRCSLMLVDKRSGEFIVKIAKGLDIGLLPSTRRVPIISGVAGKVFASGEPKIVNDLPNHDDSRILESAPVVRSSLCFPIKSNEEVVGIISASNKISGEPFTARDLSLMETLAMQASIAIKNARLYQDLNRKILELNTLHDIGKSMSLVLDLEKLLEMIIEMTSRVMGGVRSSSLILFDEETGKLQVKVYKGVQRNTPIEAISVGEGIAGKVFERGEPLMINNFGVKGAGTESDNDTPRSSLCVPLKVKEKPIGVLSVSDKITGENFDENDLSMLVTLASQIAITLNNAQLYEDLEASYLSSVRALANSLDAKDAYTRGHSERVALYSMEIGKRMNLVPEMLKTLHIGALLHDIGKIGISEAILQKTSRLTDEEYQLIKTHPVRGAAIIEPAKFLKEKVPLIKYHHERFDGNGYPEGLKGEVIPLMARIICVADSYDAMTSKRAYRDTMEKESAAQELLKCSGTQFDPKIVAAFLGVLSDEAKMKEIERYRYS